MENASRALMIAGGILIAMMIVSLLVFGLNRLSRYENAKDEAKRNEQLLEFNKQFESYNKSVIKGYEMISLANLADDMNTRYSEDKGYTPVHIYLNLQKPSARLPGGGTVKYITISGLKYYDLVDYIENTFNKLPEGDGNRQEFKQLYFQCVNTEYDSTARIIRMDFSEIKRVD